MYCREKQKQRGKTWLGWMLGCVSRELHAGSCIEPLHFFLEALSPPSRRGRSRASLGTARRLAPRETAQSSAPECQRPRWVLFSSCFRDCSLITATQGLEVLEISFLKAVLFSVQDWSSRNSLFDWNRHKFPKFPLEKKKKTAEDRLSNVWPAIWVSYFALKMRKFAFCSYGIFLFVFLKTFKATYQISTPSQENQFSSCGLNAFTPLRRSCYFVQNWFHLQKNQILTDLI